MAYKLLTLATTLAIPTLHETNSIREIKIFSTDPTLPAQCLDRDTSNQETNITDFTQALKNILDMYHHLRISISWSPPGKGLKTLARAKAAAAERARNTRYHVDNPPPHPSKDNL